MGANARQWVQVRADSVEEALDTGLRELGLASREDALVQVMRAPRRGFLGFGRVPAVVRVRTKAGRGAQETGAAGGLMEGLPADLGVQIKARLRPHSDTIEKMRRAGHQVRYAVKVSGESLEDVWAKCTVCGATVPHQRGTRRFKEGPACPGP